MKMILWIGRKMATEGREWAIKKKKKTARDGKSMRDEIYQNS